MSGIISSPILSNKKFEKKNKNNSKTAVKKHMKGGKGKAMNKGAGKGDDSVSTAAGTPFLYTKRDMPKPQERHMAIMNEIDADIDFISEFLLQEFNKRQGQSIPDSRFSFPEEPTYQQIQTVCRYAAAFFRNPDTKVNTRFAGKYGACVFHLLNDETFQQASSHLCQEKLNQCLQGMLRRKNEQTTCQALPAQTQQLAFQQQQQQQQQQQPQQQQQMMQMQAQQQDGRMSGQMSVMQDAHGNMYTVMQQPDGSLVHVQMDPNQVMQMQDAHGNMYTVMQQPDGSLVHVQMDQHQMMQMQNMTPMQNGQTQTPQHDSILQTPMNPQQQQQQIAQQQAWAQQQQQQLQQMQWQQQQQQQLQQQQMQWQQQQWQQNQQQQNWQPEQQQWQEQEQEQQPPLPADQPQEQQPDRFHMVCNP